MDFDPRVFDVWGFRRGAAGVEYLLLQASSIKAERYFNGGRFWQIPSGVFADHETVPAAVDRVLSGYALRARGIWAAEHAYTIYNRRFHAIQIISVYAAELIGGDPQLNPQEHDLFGWFAVEAAHAAVHYRGLKDGLQSVHEYVAEPASPMPELCLRA